jgi:UDP-N-acetylglucosamine acyltransferase
MIHPTAIIHPGAKLGSNVSIGPYAIIDDKAEIGDECQIASHVVIYSGSKVGPRNKFHSGCVIGDSPQDLRFKGESTGVVMGADNVIREHVTIHRSNNPAEPTKIGSNNLLMAGSHLGHNAEIGNHLIIANGALLAGHVKVADQVFISGNCLVHQFVRIGRLALMQGGSAISKDLPPYTIARGDNKISGLNIIGLRRAGFSSEVRLELKRLYHALFRRNLRFHEAVENARAEFHSEAALALLDFVATSKRGICSSRKKTESPEGE